MTTTGLYFGISQIPFSWSFWPWTAQFLPLKSSDHFNQLWQVQGFAVACDSLEVSDVVSGDATQLQRTLAALIALSFTISLSLDTCPSPLARSIPLSLSRLSAACHSASLHQRSLWWGFFFAFPPSCVYRGVGVLMYAHFHTYTAVDLLTGSLRVCTRVMCIFFSL